MIIRPGTPEDHNFVLATMLRAIKYGSDYFRAMDRTSYFKGFSTHIRRLLNGPGRLKVASLPGDVGEDDLILGYALLSSNVLHFIYVKSAFREQGVARALLADENIKYVSQMTSAGESLRQKKGWAFDAWKV